MEKFLQIGEHFIRTGGLFHKLKPFSLLSTFRDSHDYIFNLTGGAPSLTSISSFMNFSFKILQSEQTHIMQTVWWYRSASFIGQRLSLTISERWLKERPIFIWANFSLNSMYASVCDFSNMCLAWHSIYI